MVQHGRLAFYFHIALSLGFSEDLVHGIPTVRSSSKLALHRRTNGFYMRLAGGSSRIPSATDADIQASAPFDKSCTQGLKTVEKSCVYGLRNKKFSESEGCMRTPKSAGSKAATDELFSPLFKTPQKQHSVEFAGITPRARQRDLEAQISPSKIEAASPVTESETVSSPKNKQEDVLLASRLRGFQSSPVHLNPDSAIFKTPMLKNTKTLRRVVFSDTPMPKASERISSTNTKSQRASEPVRDAASRTVGDDLVHVALKQKLQLDSITVNSANLSQESNNEHSKHPDCKPVSRISLSSRRSPSRERPILRVENDHLPESNHDRHGSFGEIDDTITASQSVDILSKNEARHHALAEPQNNIDDPLRHKEEAVLASLQCNADSLHAALLELEDSADSLHESYDERGEDLHESGGRQMESVDHTAVIPTLLHNKDKMSSVASSACSFSTMPHYLSKQVSVASVPIAPLLAFNPQISFRFIFATVIFLSVPSAALVAWLGAAGGFLSGTSGWISALLVLGINISATAFAVAMYSHCAACNLRRPQP